MDIIRDKIESLIAFLLVAGALFMTGIILYIFINIIYTTVSTIIYSLYITIGCILYKIGALILF